MAVMFSPLFSMEVEVTSGQIEPSPIAVPEFYDPTDVDAVDMASIIQKDLSHSALFRCLVPTSLPQTLESLQHQVNHKGWHKLGATFVLTGKLSRMAKGEMEIHFALYNVVEEKVMLSLCFKTRRENLRRSAHLIADAVYERVCGDRGYFDTRIAYIREVNQGKSKKLMLSDWDGHAQIALTSGKNLVLTPRFSPNGQDIAYLSFDRRGTAIVYVYNLISKKTSRLGIFNGLSIAPHFSPDGKKIIFSLSRDGSTAIYTYCREKRELTKLTDNASGYISTSPCYAPNGDHIIFTSDRGEGREKIYLMEKDGESEGKSAKRISQGDGTYSQPVWSPRGDLIAFTKKYQGQFYIGVMNTDGSGERLIATGWLVEAPVWAPNGRLLMFAREEKLGKNKIKRQLYTVDLSGFHLHALSAVNDASDPAWSVPTSQSLLSKKINTP